MKKVVTFLLVAFMVLHACSSSSHHKMKNPRKAHYKTKEGKKKQKHFNSQYKGD